MPPLDMFANSPMICPSTNCVPHDLPVNESIFHALFRITIPIPIYIFSIYRAGT